MTTRIKAFVYRIPAPPHPWQVLVAPLDGDGRLTDVGHVAAATTWPAAMQAARALLRQMDRELMGEVHESRASRRTARCGGCRDLGPHRNVPDCEFYTPPRCECGPGLHSYHCPEHERHRPRSCPSCDDDAHGLGHDNTAPTCTYYRQEPTA